MGFLAQLTDTLAGFIAQPLLDMLNFDLSLPGKPKYQGMVDRLQEGIAGGHWRPGDRMPSNRELATSFGVTIGTVSKAMSEAVRRGLVETRVGSGTFVRLAPLAEVNGAPLVGGGLKVDLSLNVLPMAPVVEELRGALALYERREGVEALFRLGGTNHTERHLRTAAQWLTDMGNPAQLDQVVLTGGVHHGLVAAFQLLLQPGDVALCDVLCYTGFRRIARLRGVRLLPVSADGQGMCPDALEQALRESGAKVLITNPVLQNPLATTQSVERRAAIASVCRKNDLRVIEDAVNVPLTDPGSPSLSSHIPERSLHLAGWSKSVASGFRLGYAHMPAPWLADYRDALMSSRWFTPSFYAELLELMMAEGIIKQCVSAHLLESQSRQAILREYLPQAILAGPGYHAWLPCEGGTSGKDLSYQAARLGVSVSDAQHFAANPDADRPDGLRISLGSCENIEQLRQGLGTLSSLLRGGRPGAALAPAV